MAEDHGRPSLCHSCLFNIAIRAFFSQGHLDHYLIIMIEVSLLTWYLY